MKRSRYILKAGRAAFTIIFVLVTGLTNLFSQATILNAGDLSIIGFNSALSNRDGFAFVCWVPINAGTVIRFTDNGFNSANPSTASGNYRNNEQTATWTATSLVAAGTVVTIEGNGTTVNFVASTGTVSTVNSDGSSTTSLGLDNGGDQIFAFQGSVLVVNNNSATFPGSLLYGVGWAGVRATTGWTGSSNYASYLPSDITSYGLFFGGNAVAAEYTGPRTGLATMAEYKALVNNTANWATVQTPSGVTAYNTIAFSTGTLPLDLLSFTGKAAATGDLLSWTTANEVNTAGFDIERSTNGEIFTAIGSVLPNANHAYNYTDNNTTANSKYFYRLKMRDIDGKSTYSPVISVNYTSKPAAGYTVYPNPVAGSYLYVKSSAGSDSDIQIAVTDLSGKTWYKGSPRINNGRFEVPVKQLPAGSYGVQISEKNGQLIQTIKFSK